MVPDFQLELPCPAGGRVSRLAELKIINCCPTRYPSGRGDKAVNRRAHLLQSEYRKKAREADRNFGGVPEDTVGPVERKLEQFGELRGLVVGAFGKGSEDIHMLIDTLAESRVQALGLQKGKQGMEAEIGATKGQIRRMLSCGG